MNFYTLLQSGCLVTDGAMGTYYGQIYGMSAKAPEFDNQRAPQRIEAIHRAYISAGADIIRTNSFASNIETLLGAAAASAPREEALKAVYGNVFASCRIAQTAAARAKAGQSDEGKAPKPIQIAGDIGPIPEHAGMKSEDIVQEYKTMVKAHLDAGINLIWFETFSDFKRVLPVAEWIKSASDAFVMVSFSVNQFGYTKSGISAKHLIKTAKETPVVDGIGFNCGVGPTHLKRVLHHQDFGDLIVFAAPNSGYADRIQNRNVYQENAGYFCEAMQEIAALGVNIVGGCCGTTPEYIEKLAKTIGGRPTAERIAGHPSGSGEAQAGYENNMFIRRLYSGKKVVIAELDPPYNGDDAKMMVAAEILGKAGVEMITFSDSPMGKMRADAMMSAVKVSSRLQIDTMPHIACRDKNVIGMGASILGAYMNGLRNFLIVTGDPVPSGDRDMVTAVYDFNSVRLMNYVRQMNKEYFSEEPVAFGGALNYGRKNISVEIERMRKKCAAGASFFLTQPIYSDEDIERIKYIKSQVDTKILCGIMPLVSYRNAVFMKNEITGIHVPDEIIAKYDSGMNREEAEEVGIDIAVDIAEKLYDTADGYYFMVPFNRAPMIAEIMKRMAAKCLI